MGWAWQAWLGWLAKGETRRHEHLQLQTSHYCNGPQVEQTEWRNGVSEAEDGNDAMQCNA